MKRLVCELCGGNDIIRDGDFFVCRYCGTKYTLESARRIWLHGGAALDASEMMQNALKNARRARKNEDWEETERYYNSVEELSPENTEAVFYSAYGRARRALMTSDRQNITDALSVFSRDISMIDDHFSADVYNDQMPLIENMSRDITLMCSSGYYTGYCGYTVYLFKAVHLSFIDALENIINKLPRDQCLIRLYSLQSKHLDYALRYPLTAFEKSRMTDKQTAIDFNWGLVDPMHRRQTEIRAAAAETAPLPLIVFSIEKKDVLPAETEDSREQNMIITAEDSEEQNNTFIAILKMLNILLAAVACLMGFGFISYLACYPF